MTDYFDCLRCHVVTPIVERPPKCPKCGSGTGVVSKSPEGAVRTIDGGRGRPRRDAQPEQDKNPWPSDLH